jgi:hypothetical protein
LRIILKLRHYHNNMVNSLEIGVKMYNNEALQLLRPPLPGAEEDGFVGLIRDFKKEFFTESMNLRLKARDPSMPQDMVMHQFMLTSGFIDNGANNKIMQLEKILFPAASPDMENLYRELENIQLFSSNYDSPELDNLLRSIIKCYRDEFIARYCLFNNWRDWFYSWCLRPDFEHSQFLQSKAEIIGKINIWFDVRYNGLNSCEQTGRENILAANVFFIKLAHRLGGMGIPLSQNTIIMLGKGYCAGLTQLFSCNIYPSLGESLNCISYLQKSHQGSNKGKILPNMDDMLEEVNIAFGEVKNFCKELSIGYFTTQKSKSSKSESPVTVHSTYIKIKNKAGKRIISFADSNIGKFCFVDFAAFKIWFIIYTCYHKHRFILVYNDDKVIIKYRFGDLIDDSQEKSLPIELFAIKQLNATKYISALTTKVEKYKANMDLFASEQILRSLCDINMAEFETALGIPYNQF